MRSVTEELDGVSYTLKELTFGESNQVLDAAESMDAKGLIVIKSSLLRTHTIVLSSGLTVEEVEALPKWVGDKLFDLAGSVSGVPLETSPSSSSEQKGDQSTNGV